MDHGSTIAEEQEFLPLTDSLASRIRWRTCDYAALISAELELILAASPNAERGRLPAPAEPPSLQSEIRLLLPAPSRYVFASRPAPSDRRCRLSEDRQ